MSNGRCGWSRIMSGQAGEVAGALNAFGFCCTRNNSGVGTVLKEFDETVTTCAQAFSIIGEEIKKRLHAQSVYVASSSDSTFDVTLQLGRNSANKAVITLVPANGCNFPISCSWTRGARSSSGVQSFQTLTDLMSYIVQNLKK